MITEDTIHPPVKGRVKGRTKEIRGPALLIDAATAARATAVSVAEGYPAGPDSAVALSGGEEVMALVDDETMGETLDRVFLGVDLARFAPVC
jgi:hypothetical protein